ncbi:Aste57867_10909 [Aphanomyces stellatus]|uniref:Aste57867_10909 protein n=1 Tax=Aphanomyces stellatus TaxID=120398 RepID=A0A485KSA0_9STRA|nr:hypothetical protein As57867_010869 [Aphanomyces stellatus]VFT87777.1 Aste57867_10909 [Aphanomyces stellatus]
MTESPWAQTPGRKLTRSGLMQHYLHSRQAKLTPTIKDAKVLILTNERVELMLKETVALHRREKVLSEPSPATAPLHLLSRMFPQRKSAPAPPSSKAVTAPTVFFGFSDRPSGSSIAADVNSLLGSHNVTYAFSKPRRAAPPKNLTPAVVKRPAAVPSPPPPQTSPPSATPIMSATSNTSPSPGADVHDNPLARFMQHAAGSWQCPSCLTRNGGDKCPCCETARPVTSSSDVARASPPFAAPIAEEVPTPVDAIPALALPPPVSFGFLPPLVSSNIIAVADGDERQPSRKKAIAYREAARQTMVEKRKQRHDDMKLRRPPRPRK